MPLEFSKSNEENFEDPLGANKSKAISTDLFLRKLISEKVEMNIKGKNIDNGSTHIPHDKGEKALNNASLGLNEGKNKLSRYYSQMLGEPLFRSNFKNDKDSTGESIEMSMILSVSDKIKKLTSDKNVGEVLEIAKKILKDQEQTTSLDSLMSQTLLERLEEIKKAADNLVSKKSENTSIDDIKLSEFLLLEYAENIIKERNQRKERGLDVEYEEDQIELIEKTVNNIKDAITNEAISLSKEINYAQLSFDIDYVNECTKKREKLLKKYDAIDKLLKVYYNKLQAK